MKLEGSLLEAMEKFEADFRKDQGIHNYYRNRRDYCNLYQCLKRSNYEIPENFTKLYERLVYNKTGEML